MKTYIVTYNLSNPEENYSELFKFLKTALSWARPMTSAWIINTSVPVGEIRDGIRKRIGPQDSVLVMEISEKNWASFNIPKNITDWLNKEK